MSETIGLAFRRAMGHFTTGVAVVLASCNDAPVGLTINSLTSVSLDPPLLLFCAKNSSQSANSIIDQRFFSVNILADVQENVSGHFSRGGQYWDTSSCEQHDEWHIIPGSNGVLFCELTNIYPGGDHKIIVGEVKRILIAAAARPPLLYHRGRYNAKILYTG